MRQFVLREKSQCRALYAYLRHNWPAMAAQGKPLAVTVAEYKDKRHAQQNRLYWALLKQVSEQAMVDGRRYSDEVWHEQFKRVLIGLVDLPGGAKAGESTTKLNVSEFAEYVTKVTAYAATELGVIFEG